MASIEMNHTDIASEAESVQQMEELPLLSQQQQEVEDDEVRVDIDEMVEDEVTIDFKEMIQNCGDGLLLPECCIYRVPITIRHLKEEAYTPTIVSIGPFHYGTEKLQDMETYKQILFNRFTQKVMSSLDNLVCFVRDLEPKVRASYSGTINLTEQELVKMTLMDASFIIELFSMPMDEISNDAKLSQPWLEVAIIHDLLLLENQLPFFIIEELFNKAFPQNHDARSGPSFLELAYAYFGHYNTQNLKPNHDVKIKHFTDLLRLFYLKEKRSQRDPSSDSGRHFLLYNNADALQEAGIKLKATSGKCLLDLRLSGHILEIPQIVVDDHIELLFRNMIALEQCHYPWDSYITDYALVWDYLVDTHKDVDLLIHKKVIINFLGDSNNVCLLFNGLWKNVIQNNFNSEYIDICKRLNGYCEDPCNKMRATLRRDYCNTPWRTVASITGIILLTLAIAQTIFSILQVILK